jgi:acetyl esterase/lipase
MSSGTDTDSGTDSSTDPGIAPGNGGSIGDGLTAEELDIVHGDLSATPSIESKGGAFIDVVFKTVAGTDVKLDVYLPENEDGAPTPVMIYSHGGGWRTGDKSYVGSGSRSVISNAMIDTGVAVVSVDYRLSGNGVISYQDIIRDMKDACRFMTKYAEFYNIDPSKMLTFGDSAGAHIAMMTGLASNTDENFMEAQELRDFNDFTIMGIAGWFGPVSFMEEHSTFFTDGGRNPKSLNAMAYPASETDTDVQAMMRAIASPINYYTKNSPPLYLAHGNMDTTIPYYHLLGMQQHAELMGITNFSYTIAENAGHNFGDAIEGVAVVPSPEDIRAETIEKLLSFLDPAPIDSDTETDNSGPGYAGEWKKTRLYGHSFNSVDFTDEEYDWIRDHFEYFTIEKTHMRSAYSGPSHELTSQLTATKLLKANPRVKPLMIYSIGSGYPHLFESEAAILETNPEYFLYDANGEVDELNVANPAENDWYIETTNRITENSDLVGIFIDGFKGVYTAHTENAQYISDRMTGFRLVNGMDFAPNGLTIRGWPESSGYSDGIFIDAFFRRRVMTPDSGVVLLDALLALPNDKMFVAFSAYDGYSPTFEFSHAAYLIVANDNAYYRWVDEGHLWNSSSLMTWKDVFGKEMGAPLGKAVKNGYVYTRVFEHCTVTVDVENITSQIEWGQNNTFWDRETGTVINTGMGSNAGSGSDNGSDSESGMVNNAGTDSDISAGLNIGTDLDTVKDLGSDIGRNGVYDYAQKSYGIFVHYGWGGTAESEYGCQITQYSDGSYPQNVDEAADNFDVKGFVDDIANMHPEYLIFTAWHCGMNPLYPSAVMKKWLGEGHSSQRDVLQELLDAFEAKNIDVYFYIQPSEAHDFTPEEQAAVGYVNQNTKAKIYNDFINEVIAETTERYKTQFKGFWFDKGLTYGCTDTKRIGETVRAIMPDAVLIANTFANESADYGAVETKNPKVTFGRDGYTDVSNSDEETWPAYQRSVSFVSDRSWGAEPGKIRYTSEQMYKYTILQAGVNEEGGGVAWAMGPYPTTTISWNSGILSGMTGLGNMINEVAESIKGTTPSDSWPTAEGTTINDLEWGIATRSGDDIYEYLHVLKPPSGDALSIDSPEDGRAYRSAVNLRTGNACSLSQTADKVTITLHPNDSWDAVDSVIKLQ